MIDLTLKIRRYNPEVREDSWWDEFQIQSDPMDRLLDALHQVKWYRDGTLALRRSCAHGICGSDAMMINGHNALACKVLVRDVAPKVTVEPIRGLPVLKDLIVDMEPFFAGYRRVLPYLINDSVAWMNNNLGGVPRPVEVLVGFPMLIWGVSTRARRRQGWWMCAFAALGTATVATSLAAPTVQPEYAGWSLLYSAILGLCVGLLVSHVDMLLTGGGGQRARRGDLVEAERRPEPGRTEPLR